jgi:hypothetical protein
MTGAVLDRPAALFGDAPRTGDAAVASRGTGPAGGGHVTGPAGGGRVTLEERLEAIFRTLVAAGNAECPTSEADCPLCHARMTRTRDGGECGGCGSRLS